MEKDERFVEENGNSGRKTEIAVFVFLACFLAPILAVAGIGGFGLWLWLLQ